MPLRFTGETLPRPIHGFDLHVTYDGDTQLYIGIPHRSVQQMDIETVRARASDLYDAGRTITRAGVTVFLDELGPST